MIHWLMTIGIILGIRWIWEFIKVIDKPMNPRSEDDFWKVCYWTEYWHGPNDKI